MKLENPLRIKRIDYVPPARDGNEAGDDRRPPERSSPAANASTARRRPVIGNSEGSAPGGEGE